MPTRSFLISHTHSAVSDHAPLVEFRTGCPTPRHPPTRALNSSRALIVAARDSAAVFASSATRVANNPRQAATMSGNAIRVMATPSRRLLSRWRQCTRRLNPEPRAAGSRLGMMTRRDMQICESRIDDFCLEKYAEIQVGLDLK